MIPAFTVKDWKVPEVFYVGHRTDVDLVDQFGLVTIHDRLVWELLEIVPVPPDATTEPITISNGYHDIHTYQINFHHGDRDVKLVYSPNTIDYTGGHLWYKIHKDDPNGWLDEKLVRQARRVVHHGNPCFLFRDPPKFP